MSCVFKTGESRIDAQLQDLPESPLPTRSNSQLISAHNSYLSCSD